MSIADEEWVTVKGDTPIGQVLRVDRTPEGERCTTLVAESEQADVIVLLPQVLRLLKQMEAASPWQPTGVHRDRIRELLRRAGELE